MVGARRMVVGWAVASIVVLGACSGDDDTAADAQKASSASEEAAVTDPADVPAEASAGCGSSTVAAGEEKVTTQSAGAERWYWRSVPAAHDGDEPVPLVLDLHGYSEGADVHKANSKLGELGAEEGFVTLTPQGVGQVPFWNTTPDSTDVDFVGQVLDEAEAALCIDTNRVFVTGFSNGAMMTSTVACVMSDRIAAAAPVSGAVDLGDACAAERPVPVVTFHGTADPFLDFEGGLGPAVANLPKPDGSGSLGDLDADESDQMDETVTMNDASVPEVMAAWAERNGCDDAAPTETEEAADVTLVIFDCPPDAEVELYRIEGGGHTWPGSHLLEGVDMVGPTTFSIDADDIMWAFFQAHPLQP
jgi:polyhydroxybutyrate depolymerase